MEQSLYFDYIQKYFPRLVLGVSEKLNNKEEAALPYLHKQLLGTDYSVDGRWETLTGNYTRVSADVVAMDSALPLKKRDALGRASGDLPKLGMELYLNEKQMSEIDSMIAMGMNEATITSKIFADTPRVITGVYERLEDMFLRGLSTGSAVADANNVGTGVRINYGYLPSNQLGVDVLWADPTTAKPLDDIQRVVNKARGSGHTFIRAYTDQATVDKFLATTQVREQFSFSVGIPVVDVANIPIPSLEQGNAVLRSKFGIELVVINRSVITEIDGVQTVGTPWKAGTIVFTVDSRVGSLMWTRLAEQNHPVAGVTYQTADQYILVSKYRVNRPSLREYTASQARVVPVISNVDRIYTLDTLTVQE